MANIVGLNDGNLLSADNVYDSNQATDQQTINANQQAINSSQQTTNNEVLNVTKHIIPYIWTSTNQTKITVKVKSRTDKAFLVVLGNGNGSSVMTLCMHNNGVKNVGYLTTPTCTFSNWTWVISNLPQYGVYMVLSTHEIESWSVS